MNNSSSARLANELRRWVSDAPTGARLPSTRALVAQHSVSAATVRSAMARLEAEGLIATRPGDGTYALAPRTAAAPDYDWQTAALGALPAAVPHDLTPFRDAPTDHLNLAEGYPEPGLLPVQAVRSALARAAKSPAVLRRAPSAGLPELRAWFAAELASRTPAQQASVAPRDVVVLPGSQAGLGAVFRALAGPGQPVLIESPTYWGALLAAEQSGVRLIPVASGPQGPDPREVERSLRESGARLFYAQPSFANPHGGVWPQETRDAIMGSLRQHRAFIIEDEWSADFGIDTQPTPLGASDPDGHVIGIRSLTKSLSPALRIAAVSARGPAFERVLAEVRAQTMYVSPILQAALLDVVTQPAWAAHRKRLAGELRERRDRLVGALARHAPQLSMPSLPLGGLNLWVQLPPGLLDSEVERECQASGLMVLAGRRSFPAEPTGQFLRLNYAGARIEDLDAAARILGEVVARMLEQG